MALRTWLIVTVGLGLVGCSDSSASLPGEIAAPLVGGGLSQLSPVDLALPMRARLSSPSVPELGTLSAAEHADLAMLYAQGAKALWTNAALSPTENARDLLDLLEDAASHGLDARDYGSTRLRQVAIEIEAADVRAPADEIAGFDVAMSAAALRYFRHLHFGRVDPRTIGFSLSIPVDRHDVAALVRSAIEAHRIPEAAAELVPPLVQYRQLRDMLGRYRSLAAAADLAPPPSFAGTLHPGDVATAQELRALSRRLGTLGDLEAYAGPLEPAPAVYDEPLVQGVRRFQARHGLEPDGVLGRATQAALGVPLSWRVRQIELSLERLRWLPDLTNERVIALNIPMFRLWAWDAVRPDSVPAFATRAIVGRALRTETPVFVEELREVIFRPYWNVPRSILRGEILPIIEKDPDYLRRQEMEIVRGPGDDGRVVPPTGENLALLKQGGLRLRQRPGARNALGLVKFVFPNDANVYMHDTPAHELFSKARRDFSHGCVRVEDPVSLAEWVLAGHPDWTRDRILSAMSGSETRRVTIERPIQVVLFYVTAGVVPEDGALHFAEDIYGHDAVLDRALAGRRRQRVTRFGSGPYRRARNLTAGSTRRRRAGSPMPHLSASPAARRRL